MNRSTLFATIAVLIIAALALIWGLRNGSDKQIASQVLSFEDCRKAGYPIMESYPEQCRTPDGRTFTRIIEPAPAATTSPSESVNSYKDMITVVSPKSGEIIGTPLTMTGRARGNWYFEATFPVKLVDSKGKVLVQSYAEAQGEWMTTEYVPFKATLAFTLPNTTEQGFLVLEKSNASGLPEHADEFRIPVTIKAKSAGAGSTTTQAACYVGGCSGEVCSDRKDVASNCIYKPEFACYKESYARCERQSTGQCGWTETSQLKACIEGAVSVNSAQ